MLLVIVFLLLFIAILIIEPRLYLNIYVLSLLIVFGLINTADFFIPIVNSEGHINLFYIILLTFIFPIILLLIFALTLFNTRKIVAKEGKRITNLLVFVYGLFLFLDFLIINYQPYLLFHYRHGIIGLYLNFIFWYFNIILLSQTLYSMLLSFVSNYKNPDYILILGSGLIGDRVPPLLQSRLNKGIELKNKFPKAKIIVSGGQGPDELVSESEAMGKYLIEQGIKETDIIFETESTTTYENLVFSKQKVQDTQTKSPFFTIVSNNFHVLRAAFLSRKVKLKATVAGSYTASYFYPNAFIREFIACLVMYKKSHAIILILATLGFIYFLAIQ